MTATERLTAGADVAKGRWVVVVLVDGRFQRALAAATRTSTSQAKWSGLADARPGSDAESEPLFYRSSGAALPIVREPDPVFAFGDIKAHAGETLTPFFIGRLRSLLGMA